MIGSVVRKMSRIAALAGAALLLTGCDVVLLNPSGDIARQQSDLLVTSTWLMLLIVVPVIGMSLWFAWWYREGNEKATYTPEWDHSTLVELYVWAAPLLIIIALGAITWITTHTLDPYRPLERVAEDQPLPENTKHMKVRAIALEWKWLFIYPEQGIAVVNEAAAPVNVPLRFETTSPKMMNSLYIPSLAGMVYAMPGMETPIHAVINEPGDYHGMSGNYSGFGYSNMKFRFYGMGNKDFEQWVQKVRSEGEKLDTATYLELATRKTEAWKLDYREPIRYFSSVEEGLYHRILNLCVEAGKMCLDDMMAHKNAAHGGKHGGAAEKTGH